MNNAQFNALDKNSGQCFSQSVNFDSEDELKTMWAQFKEDVPFFNWYPDNVFYGDSEHYTRLVEDELD